MPDPIGVYVRVRRFRQAVPAILIMVALPLLMLPDFLVVTSFSARLVRAAGLSLLTLSVVVLVFDYLQGRTSERLERPDYFRSEERLERLFYELRNLREEYRVGTGGVELREEISDLRNLLKHQLPSTQFTETEKKELLEVMRAQIGATLNDDFLKVIDSRYGTAALAKSRVESLARDFEVLRQRLLEEVRALQRRASFNLAIGGVTTFLAMIALAYVVFRSTPDFHSALSVASHYVPRITFVVFIEVFAFFFLRLYKLSLDDIKYYQNELTNAESRIIALRAALMDDKAPGLIKIVQELSTTERNFVLKKGETTVDLERRKLEANEGTAIIDKVTTLVDKVKPKS